MGGMVTIRLVGAALMTSQPACAWGMVSHWIFWIFVKKDMFKRKILGSPPFWETSMCLVNQAGLPVYHMVTQLIDVGSGKEGFDPQKWWI